MIQAEEICLTASDHRLYFAVGYSLIQAIKSMATFEPKDLEDAIQCCRNTIHIAQLLRKHDYGVLARVGSIAKGSASVAIVKSMTVTQRHAELVYSECTLLKVRSEGRGTQARDFPTHLSLYSQAVLSMAYSGDFIAFLKEALNMRAAHATYRTLAQFVELADAAYGGEDPSIDQDFRSGVNLGNGMISLILSLLPSTVLKIVEVFGFSGDREAALRMLMKPGGWKSGVEEPAITETDQGIRRPSARTTRRNHLVQRLTVLSRPQLPTWCCSCTISSLPTICRESPRCGRIINLLLMLSFDAQGRRRRHRDRLQYSSLQPREVSERASLSHKD